MSSLLGLWYRWWGWMSSLLGCMVQVMGLDEVYAVVYGTGGGVGMSSLLGFMVEMVGLG